jgi:hypothetical protein
MNLHFETGPTEWMYLTLYCPVQIFGIASATVSKVGAIDSKKIPPIFQSAGNSPCVPAVAAI